MLHFLICADIQSTVVGKEEVSDYCLLHLSDGLQASGIEYPPISSVSQMDTILTVLEGIGISIAANTILKSVGASTQPCFTPLVI